MLPAPGQGALAVECRASDPALAALLGAVAAVTAERSLLEALAGGGSAPIAAYAAGTEELRMWAAVMSADGRRVLHAHGATPAVLARQLGRNLAAQLLRSGAADLISVNKNGACHMSRTMSVPGWAQQMSTSPSAGGSSGSGE
jgi:hydroxymethylbilane synthase